MLDSHTHLDSLDDPDGAVDRAMEAGVTGMVTIGCGADSIRECLDIARRNREVVRIAAGVHPQMAAGFDMHSDWAQVADLARMGREEGLVVAIGETGYDQYRDHGTLAEQDPAFEAQCELARELQLPLVIHTRAAEEHTLAQLEEHASDLDVILHCYSLVEDEHVERVLGHERWTCSFAGNVTYKTAQDLRDAAARIPLERTMVETDAPYLTPVPHRGEKNEPAFVQHTLACIAEVHGVSAGEAARATMATGERLFGWAGSAAMA